MISDFNEDEFTGCGREMERTGRECGVVFNQRKVLVEKEVEEVLVEVYLLEVKVVEVVVVCGRGLPER